MKKCDECEQKYRAVETATLAVTDLSQRIRIARKSWAEAVEIIRLIEERAMAEVRREDLVQQLCQHKEQCGSHGAAMTAGGNFTD